MTIIAPLPNNIQNGDPIDATPVMANLDQIVSNVNANAADLNQQNTFSQPQNGVAAILPGQFPILSQMQALFNSFIPIGAVLDFAGTAVPTGNSWLLCDGSLVSRTTYALLFAAIGTTWGVGDGVSTFGVPDMRRASSVGSGGTSTGTLGNTVGSAGGAETHVVAVTELPAHNHGVNDPTHVHGVGDPGHAHGYTDPGHAHAVNDPGHAHTYTAPGSGTVAGGVTFFGGSTQAAATAGSGTGIGIFAAAVGITIAAAGTGIFLGAAATGITTQNTGSGAAMNIYHPVRVMTKMIRTGL